MAIKRTKREFCVCTGEYLCEFFLDTEADVEELPKCGTGSTALVTATGNVYVVNASGAWAKFGEGRKDGPFDVCDGAEGYWSQNNC